MSKRHPKPAMPSEPSNTDIPVQENETIETNVKLSQHHNASAFVSWYKNMVDNERQNFSLYLSDDATLEWFGRTIKTRKKMAAFLNHDMQCSRHDFTSIEIIEKIPPRQERLQRTDDSILASPMQSPELVRSKPTKRKHMRLRCTSPQWAEGCQLDDEDNVIGGKRLKTSHIDVMNVNPNTGNINNNSRISNGAVKEISNNGDCMKGKDKCVLVTPPNIEVGQGDCIPSTSGTDSDRSHETLTAQLPKMAVECNGYVEFTRTRNNRSIDSVKWERKCKVQISYSDDPLNVGEYIIWLVRYYDENKCRRNLLDAFEKVSKD